MSSKGVWGRMLLCFAFALGIPLVFRQFLRSEVPVWLVLVPVALTTTAGVVRETVQAGRLLMTVVSSILAAVYAVSLLAGLLMTPYSAYSSWFQSVRSGLPEGSISDLFVLLLGFFAAVFSPMVFSVGSLWPVFTLSLAVVFLLAVMYQSLGFVVLVIVCVGACLLYFTLRRMPEDHRAIGFVLPFAVALVCVSATGIVSTVWQRQRLGNRFVNESVYPALRRQVVVAFPRFPLIYGIPGYGFSLDTKKLGQTPLLSRLPIFEVEGPPGEIVYLKTAVYDSYDGRSWRISDLYRHTPQSAMESGFLRNRSVLAGDGDIVVRPLARAYNRVPYTLDTVGVEFSGGLPEIEFGGVDVGFLLRRPMDPRDTLVLLRDPHGRDGHPQLGREPVESYLQVPARLPGEVRRLADRLASGAQSAEEILLNIERFLAHNYQYDLNPPNPTGREDFVYRFLFIDQQGYCVQFATSFVLLARLSDIPARYAIGFLVYLSSEDGRGEATGLSAHAWPEVWVDGEGWRVWEATPAVNLSYYTQVGDALYTELDLETDSYTSAQLEDILDIDISTESPATDPPVETSVEIAERTGLPAAWLIPSVLIFLAALFAVVHLSRRREDEKLLFVRAGRLVRGLRRRGVVDPERVGWVAWGEDLQSRLPARRNEIRRITEILLRSTYGGGAIQSSDAGMFRTSAREIARSIGTRIPR